MSKESYAEQVERATQDHMRLWQEMSDAFLKSQSKHWITWHREAALRLLKNRGLEGMSNDSDKRRTST